MEFFCSDEELASLEEQFRAAQGEARLPLQVALAWALRQRNSARALALADEVEQQLPLVAPACANQYRLRLRLVRAEVHWLMGELAQAENVLTQTLGEYQALHDAQGQADAYWLLAWVASDKGEIKKAVELLVAMCDCAIGDSIRLTVAQATQARLAAFSNVQDALAIWGVQLPADYHQLPTVAMCWVADFYGAAAQLKNEYVQAIRHLNVVHGAAVRSGQQRRAVIALNNIAYVFHQLNDYQTALVWSQRAVEMARECRYPGLIGNALMWEAENLRQMQSLSVAQEVINESINLMASQIDSRNYAIGVHILAKLTMDLQDYQQAIVHFGFVEQRGRILHNPDLVVDGLLGQAKALLAIGKAEPAHELALRVMNEGQVIHKIRACMILAETQSNLSPEACVSHDTSTALQYLNQGLALATSIENYLVPRELLEALARESARLGNFAQAYDYASAATLALEKNNQRESANRSMAMQVSLAIDKAQTELEQQRQFAAAQASRAGFLQQANHTLAHLGDIGQEITASLHAERIFEVLNRHVQHLLAVSSFAIFLLEKDGLHIALKFGVEDGEALPPIRIAMNDANNQAVRCIIEQCEILSEYAPDDKAAPMIANTRLNLSSLFAPLGLGAEILGAMTIQSAHAQAYGERELMIFRSLCAYAAIALSNAQTHRQLQETQQQMLLQEKMAGLGTLTAGVAHEINNPTNFAHVAAQILQRDLSDFEEFLNALVQDDDAQEVVEIFRQRFANLQECTATVLNGTERIKGIVRDLRSFTRLDEAEKKAIHLSECIQSTVNLVRTSWLEQVEFIIEIEADPIIECWPALLNQVLMNLLVNGCQAIAEKRQQNHIKARGEVRLHLSQQDQFALLAVRDNGIGIEPATQARVMEPFFTTKAVGSGTGMGLAIAFGIVEKHGGSLQFSSVYGEGSCFTIRLPLRDAKAGRVGELPASL